MTIEVEVKVFKGVTLESWREKLSIEHATEVTTEEEEEKGLLESEFLSLWLFFFRVFYMFERGFFTVFIDLKWWFNINASKGIHMKSLYYVFKHV